MTAAITAAIIAIAAPTAAHAAPGLADEVYAATVQAGEPEVELRYGRLGGGPDHGEDALKVEAGYGVTDRLRLAGVFEFEREAGLSRKAEAASLEAIYALGKAGGIDVALYGEYEIGFHGPDKVETKLLLQRRTDKFDLRLNLIAEKPLASGSKVELGYAAGAYAAVGGDIQLGVEAYGELGNFSRFAPHAEHFIGPVAKFEIEGLGPELGLQLGYLFALDKARDDTDGQLQVRLEMEF
ncbi:hypothetical protein ACFOD9_10370 [Novosphingobium bradum]|uniref:Uncharacterized protein n=1 Tax=Novosphingobium bradum TaxID=1737444 RepID=A0ABV7IWR9_9SPHN